MNKFRLSSGTRAVALGLGFALASLVCHGQDLTGAKAPSQGWTATMSSKYDDRSGGDPQAALKGDPKGTFSFHTAHQTNPWWTVDFQKEITLDKVTIFNRTDCCSDRTYSLEVMLAPEGSDPTERESWKVVYSNAGKPFGGVDPRNPAKDLTGNQAPLVVNIPGRKARYLKIQLNGQNYLHLDKVKIKEQKALTGLTPSSSLGERDLLGNSNDPFAKPK